jgi:hypothetical protein
MIPKIADLIANAFSGDTYRIGLLVGTLVYFSIHLSVAFALFKYGIEWLSKGNAQFNNNTILDEDLLSTKTPTKKS